MELQERLGDLEAGGLGLVAISYDSRAILADFARRRGITFPLLSDIGSEIIKRYGLLNRAFKPGDEDYGIPYPGSFVLDSRGLIVDRFFEEAYQERNTVGSLLVKKGAKGAGESTTIITDHLQVVTSASNAVVAPGSRFSLVVDVTPNDRIHVYAPGNDDYIPITVQIDPQTLITVHPTEYPAAEEYFFEPLNERVKVYQKATRIVQDITVGGSPSAQDALKGRDSLTVKGTVRYQACDDRVCFTPVSVPVSWTVKLRPLDKEPTGIK